VATAVATTVETTAINMVNTPSWMKQRKQGCADS